MYIRFVNYLTTSDDINNNIISYERNYYISSAEYY